MKIEVINICIDDEVYRNYYYINEENKALKVNLEDLQQYRKGYIITTREYKKLQDKYDKLETKHRKSAKLIAKLKEDRNYYINKCEGLQRMYRDEKSKKSEDGGD